MYSRILNDVKYFQDFIYRLQHETWFLMFDCCGTQNKLLWLAWDTTKSENQVVYS